MRSRDPRVRRFRTVRPSWPFLLSWSNQAFFWLERVSRHKILMCLLVMAITMATRIALLPRIPIPQPYIADEFSYLLGAETFASGRVTNPMHPMWVHFEAFHELMRPTYMNKYPPGQALFLALGWKLLGHPWYGVWISFGLFSACLCWMLQNWVPPTYAVLGTAITLTNISILGYWMNSYWGGAVAAIAGCLLLGAVPRLANRVKAKDVAIAAVALVLLANTRPYEGLVMSVAAIAGLLVWRARGHRKFIELVSPRCAIPFLLICGAGALLDGYYNYRVTGNALLMPYTLYARDYTIAPPLIILPARNPPVYQHVILEKSFELDLEHYQRVKSSLIQNLTELYRIFHWYCSSLLLFPVVLAILLSRSYRLWMAVAICSCVWGGLLIEFNKFPHYIAPGVGLLPLLAVYGFRLLRVIGRSHGPVLVLTLATLLCVQGAVATRSRDRGTDWETGRQSPQSFAAREAKKEGGRSLIIVRYVADRHNGGDECVFNSADIDASQIVWARDMGEAKNRELINYYRSSRKVWLYEPDTDPRKLIPYASVSK